MRDTRIHNQDSLASGKKTIPIPANTQRLHKLCVCTEQRVAADNIDRGEHNDDDGDRGAAKAGGCGWNERASESAKGMGSDFLATLLFITISMVSRPLHARPR